MRSILDSVLAWAEGQLPKDRQVWVSELRTEAQHIPNALARQRFLWSGAVAALGTVLHLKIGPQKLGQMLLGCALLLLCLGGLLIMSNMPNDIVRTTFYLILPLYAVAGGLAVFNLGLMKRFTFGCSLLLASIWVGLGLGISPALGGAEDFLRALSLEAAFMMAGLFIAASYLGWIEDSSRA